MKSIKSCPRVFSLLTGLFGAVIFIFSASTSAHTVQICWKDVGTVTTFYAGTYHNASEGPSPIGGIIVDSFEFPFSGWIPKSALPTDAHCRTNISNTAYQGTGNVDGVAQSSVNHFQTFTSAFVPGAHTVTFTATNVVQSPIGAFPLLTFGGGACTDADFDGICNDVDSCPLDFSNDGDGDGICGNVDNCPLVVNPSQIDANGNGQGDACEGQVCGNGLVTGAEQCDDGNIAGGDGCSAICTIELADTPPVANAGPVQVVNEGDLVTLDGSASTDAEDPLTYAWVQQPGGTTVALSGNTTVAPTFTAPTVAVGGETLSFMLTVTANGVTATSLVSITVANVNHTPVADAGSELSIAEGSPVVLDGSASFDMDLDPFSYTWVQTSGTPTVVITGANTATPSFTAPVVGTDGAPGVVATLVFTLTVADNLPQNAPADGYAFADVSDTVTVEVTNVNNLPVADAGTDLTINEFTAGMLNGNGSNDPDGDPLTYSWVQVADAAPAVSLNSASTATPGFTTPFVSDTTDVTYELTVDDGYGGTSTDQVVVHVLNPNDPPDAANAFPSETCLWPPNHSLHQILINGVSDAQDNATITINSVTQDEPTNGLGDGDTAVDAVINNDGTVNLRAERSGKGDGRMYHIHFTASDLEGSDSGVVNVCVQHNKKSVAIDGGELHDSTQ